MQSNAGRKGSRRKSSEGLDKVLYVRVSPDLLEALDEMVSEERARHPGRAVSRADVARELLYRAAQRKNQSGAGSDQGSDPQS